MWASNSLFVSPRTSQDNAAHCVKANTFALMECRDYKLTHHRKNSPDLKKPHQ